MKNYYDILGLSSYEDSQDVILDKYKKATEMLSSHVMNKDMRSQLIDINEAFLVLSDITLKRKYDYALSIGSERGELSNLLLEKRQKSEQFITDKLVATPKRRKKNKWPAIICGLLLLSALGTLLRICSQAYIQDQNSSVVDIGLFSVPSGWTNYSIDGAFSLSVPQTMELSQEYDCYIQWNSENLGVLDCSDAIFQQKGLSEMEADALGKYARVIAESFSLSSEDLPHYYDSPALTPEDFKEFREIVDDEIKPYTYLNEPRWRWIEIDGTKALEGTYRRNGEDGPVKCKFYILFNLNQMAKVIVAFREKDSEIWESDLNNVIRTFKWTTPR